MALQLLIGSGERPGVAVVALALLFTYALHAFGWTFVAAGLARRKSLSIGSQNALWRLAVFAPLATTCLALALPAKLESSGAGPTARHLQLAWVKSAAPRASTLPHANALWATLGACALGCAFLGLARWLTAALVLAHRLSDRTAVTDARWLQRLEHLRCRTRVAKVRLTQSRHVGSPMVVGVTEICVPADVLALDDPELDSVLAHELSHIERRDGIWFPLTGLVAAVLWLQPLSAWAAARFRKTAEESCDDRAVELTRDAQGLARVLLQLASAAATPARSALAPSMASSSGTLLGRVQRLTSARPSAPGRSPRYATLLVSLSLAAMAFATASLSVRVAGARAPSAPSSAIDPKKSALFPAISELAPDANRVSNDLAELERRAHELEASIALTATQPDAERVGSPSAVRLLELRQELHHLRAMQQWTEQRFLEDETTWQAQHAPEKR